MEARSILREHTLVLAGETVESGSVWQGWPSSTQESLGIHRSRVKRLLDRSLQFRITAAPTDDQGEDSQKKKPLLRRVFYGNDSVRWKRDGSNGHRGEEAIPLLNSNNEMRSYSKTDGMV